MGDLLDPVPRIRLVAKFGAPSFEVRPAKPSDMGYVVQTWREEAREALFIGHHGHHAQRFNNLCREFAARSIERCTIQVAAPPDDPRTIYGFIVREPGCVHLVYVKSALRRMGIGASLMEGTGIKLSAIPRAGKDFASELLKAMPMAHYGFWLGGTMTENSKGRKVVSITTREGGVDMVGPTGNKNWTTVKAGPEAQGLTSSPTIEMDLDPSLGGVLVRYGAKAGPRTLFVPMSHIRQMELA